MYTGMRAVALTVAQHYAYNDGDDYKHRTIAMTKEQEEVLLRATTLLREYAEVKWFGGERAVEELRKEQEEDIQENWSAEMEAGEDKDKESELFHLIESHKAEREAVSYPYSRKYHEIHDVIRELDGVFKQ